MGAAQDVEQARGEIRDVAIADLSRHPQNYRQHPEAQLDRIAESLRRNGQRKAVVVQAGTMRIIAGHGVVEAAQSLGWDTIRCDVWNCDDDQAAAYMVDDNELSRHAEDDDAVLAGLLVDLQDTDFPPISFDEAELDELLGSGTAAEPFDSEGGVERVIHKRLIAIVVDEVLHGELIAIIAERYPDLAGNEAVVKLLSDASQKT